MLKFSQESIIFQYNIQKHLETNITITNQSQQQLYYKFKVNRPRYYLLKPDRGVLKYKQSHKIVIKLHRQGIAEANQDKFKCFYRQVNSDRQPDKFEQAHGTLNKKLFVLVLNTPKDIETSPIIPTSNSQIKNIDQIQYQRSTTRTRFDSTTYQSIIQQKHNRIAILTREIQSIQKQSTFNNNNTDNKTSSTNINKYGVILVLGMFIGIVSSLWI